MRDLRCIKKTFAGFETWLADRAGLNVLKIPEPKIFQKQWVVIFGLKKNDKKRARVRAREEMGRKIACPGGLLSCKIAGTCFKIDSAILR